MDTISSKSKEVLKSYFGYDTFRPLQEEIIESIVAQNDNLVLMPTGGGKSLCYQIPAILMDGICIVVSPLISLMKDQVETLISNGVSANFLNSSLSADEYNSIISKLINNKIDLLYVSPEKLMSQDFFLLLERLPIRLFAVDEAHCISAWGHDFRPEYTRMKIMKKEFPHIPIVALTATADEITRNDIVKQLGLKNPNISISSFDRPNLSLKVMQGRDKFRVIENFISERPQQSGIIYCLSRKSTETICAKLQALDIKADYYHAGLNIVQRTKSQDDFINDRTPIICATVAFGMGIDKSNVRWIIHYNLPKNIESYYQEIGRAGRDGLPSDTILFYSFADVMSIRNFLIDSGQKELQTAKLEQMEQYATSQICRRRILLNYFGESQIKNCGNCDVCTNPPTYFDGTTIAQKTLSAMVRLKEKVATGTLIDVLRGSKNYLIIKNDYHKIKTYGSGADISQKDWQIYLQQLLQLGVISIAYDHHYFVQCTPLSSDILKGDKSIELVQPSVLMEKREKSYEKPKSKTQLTQDELFEILRKLRKEIAVKKNVPPYVVFSDVTLKEMVAKKPIKMSTMKNITGVGDHKYKLYGGIFIDAILRFVQDKAAVGVKTVKGSSHLLTLKYIKENLTVEEIATKRAVKPATIYGHIVSLYEEGHPIDIKEYLSPEEIKKIVNAIKKIGNFTSLTELFIHLNEEIAYYKIRLGLAYWKRQK